MNININFNKNMGNEDSVDYVFPSLISKEITSEMRQKKLTIFYDVTQKMLSDELDS